MLFIPDEVLDRLITEDVPYLDLTTWVLGCGQVEGEMEYFTRQAAVLCGSEEAVRILEKLHVQVDMALPTGTMLQPGQVFLRAQGRGQDLHLAWKVCQNIFDHCSAIATRTKEMVDRARAVNPHITIVTTRKGFPGTKALSIKAVLAGGAFPHRLGLSETVLVFPQHIRLCGGMASFLAQIPQIKQHICEKKLIVEAQSVAEGLTLCGAGVDGLQFDKLPPAELSQAVPRLRQINPQVALLAAGGVTLDNVAAYAQTGVDALVTTSLYHVKPIDMGVRINAKAHQ